MTRPLPPGERDPRTWIACAERLPEEGVVVESGIVQASPEGYIGWRNDRMFKDGSWRFPDGGPAWTPTHWRVKAEVLDGGGG